MKKWVSVLGMLLVSGISYGADREINLAPGTSALLEVNVLTRVYCSIGEPPICSVERHADTAVIVKIGNESWAYYVDGSFEENYAAAVAEIRKLRSDGLCR